MENVNFFPAYNYTYDDATRAATIHEWYPGRDEMPEFRRVHVKEGDDVFTRELLMNPLQEVPDVVDYALGHNYSLKLVPGQLTDIIADINNNWVNDAHNNSLMGWNCSCLSIMRELRIRFTIYNPNVELYVHAEYKFRQTEEGILQPQAQMKVRPPPSL